MLEWKSSAGGVYTWRAASARVDLSDPSSHTWQKVTKDITSSTGWDAFLVTKFNPGAYSGISVVPTKDESEGGDCHWFLTFLDKLDNTAENVWVGWGNAS